MELRRILTSAFEQSPIVRVIGNHDRGKSQAVSERIRWLIERNARPESICVLSHTMQLLRILRYAMAEHVGESNFKQADHVRFTTPNYLAQQISSITEHGNLPKFKYDHTIEDWELRELKEENCNHLIDTWQNREMLDTEFAVETGRSLQRCQEIRESCEALWCTGESTPPNYDAPARPVTEEEQAAFSEFLPGREKFYVYAVQGRRIRKGLEHCESASLEPAKLVDIEHVIVDDYHDLNPVEIESSTESSLRRKLHSSSATQTNASDGRSRQRGSHRHTGSRSSRSDILNALQSPCPLGAVVIQCSWRRPIAYCRSMKKMRRPSTHLQFLQNPASRGIRDWPPGSLTPQSKRLSALRNLAGGSRKPGCPRMKSSAFCPTTVSRVQRFSIR